MSTTSARGRLLRDLYEYRRAAARGELTHITACPCDDDITLWHVNVRAAPDHTTLEGLILHLVVRFPQSYPRQPPTVELSTPIPHPNVFAKRRPVLGAARPQDYFEICIDMLGNCSDLWDGHGGAGPQVQSLPYTGWSPAYSVLSLLLQLESFLLDEDMLYEEHNGVDAARALAEARAFRVRCGTADDAPWHSHEMPWPAFAPPGRFGDAHLRRYAVHCRPGDPEGIVAAAGTGHTDAVANGLVMMVRPPPVKPFVFASTARRRRALEQQQAAKAKEVATTVAAKVDAHLGVTTPAQHAPCNAAAMTVQSTDDQQPRLQPQSQPQPQHNDPHRINVASWVCGPELAKHGLAGEDAAAVAAALMRAGVTDEAALNRLLPDNAAAGDVPIALLRLLRGGGRHSARRLARCRRTAAHAVAQAWAQRQAKWRDEVLFGTVAKHRRKYKRTAITRADVAAARPSSAPHRKLPAPPVWQPEWTEVQAYKTKHAAPVSSTRSMPISIDIGTPEACHQNRFVLLQHKARPPMPPKTSRTIATDIEEAIAQGSPAARINNLKRSLKRALKREAQAEVTAARAVPAAAEAEADSAVAADAASDTCPSVSGETSATPLPECQALEQRAVSTTEASTDHGQDWSYAGRFGTTEVNALFNLLAFLGPAGVGSIAVSCRFMRETCVDGRLWRVLFSHRFPTSDLRAQTLSGWKTCFSMQMECIHTRLRCFFSKTSPLLTLQRADSGTQPCAAQSDRPFRDSGATLGIPISISTNPRTGEIDYMHSTFDLLSHDAFAARGVRRTVWNEKFTHWLPVYLSEAHFQLAIDAGIVQRALVRLCPYAVDTEGRKASDLDAQGGRNARSDCANWRRRGRQPEHRPRETSATSAGTFHPGVVLHVLPKLLNTAVVLLADRGVHASDHAVEGYCLLHRLFVALMHQYPALQGVVARRVQKFVQSEVARGKDQVRAMGEFVPLLAVCNEMPWCRAIFPVVQECFDRSVMWACKKHPVLAEERNLSAGEGAINEQAQGDAATPGNASEIDEQRLKLTLEATRVGRRLLMFHSLFVRHLARPAGRSVEDAAHALDHSFGIPLEWQKRELRDAVRRVLDNAKDTWPAYFACVGVPCPSRKGLSTVLRNSLASSARRGYHKKGMDFSRVHRSGISQILLKGESYTASPSLRRMRMQEVWHWATQDTLYLDASVLLYGFKGNFQGVVDYQHTQFGSGTISHSGDQMNHARHEGVHSIDLTLRSQALAQTQCMFFTMSAWRGAMLRHIRQPHVRLCDHDSGHELCRYNFCESERAARTTYGDASCVIMCKVWRPDRQAPWQVEAVGTLCDGAADNYAPIRQAVEQMLPHAQ